MSDARRTSWPNGAMSYVSRVLRSAFELLLKRFRRARMTSNVTFMSMGAILVLGEAFILLVGIQLFLDGALSLGTVFAVQYYAQLLAQPVDGLGRELQDLHRATASVRRIQQLMDERSTIVDGAGLGKTTQVAPTIDFLDVTFSYDVQPVLNNVSFSVAAGEVLAIVGRTGRENDGRQSDIEALRRYKWERIVKWRGCSSRESC